MGLMAQQELCLCVRCRTQQMGRGLDGEHARGGGPAWGVQRWLLKLEVV